MEEHQKTQLRNKEVVTPEGIFSEAVKEEQDSQILDIVIGGLIAIGGALIYLIWRLIC